MALAVRQFKVNRLDNSNISKVTIMVMDDDIASMYAIVFMIITNQRIPVDFDNMISTQHLVRSGNETHPRSTAAKINPFTPW